MSAHPQRLTIGLGIGRDSVRAIAIKGERIAWAVERARDDEPLSRTIEQVLADAPLPRWPRPRVAAAVGPSHSQTKRLMGLPPVADGARLDDVVRESSSRFFLKNGIPLVTTCHATAGGDLWGAAVERPVLEAIEQACKTSHVRLRAIVPTLAVLGHAVDASASSTRLEWRDGEASVEVTIEGGTLAGVRRPGPGTNRHAGDREMWPMLTALGPDGWRFADALGAARSGPAAALSWRSEKSLARSTRAPRWRVSLAIGAAAIAGAAVLAAPGAAARVVEQRAATSLASLGPLRASIAAAEREVEKVTSALDEVATFDQSRYSVTVLLRDLTGALPEGSAVITIRLTRASGTVVALAPRASAVVTKVEGIRGIEAVEIVGPVTREVVAGKALERVSIRFQVRPAARRQSSVSGGSER